MNWIVKNNKRTRFQTNLNEVLKPIWKELEFDKCIILDVDFMTNDVIPINFDHKNFELTYGEFQKLILSDTQIIWGIFLFINGDCKIDWSILNKFSSEDEKVWTEEYFINESIMELIAFDSSYTILKIKKNELSIKFKNYFEKDAIELKNFK